MITVPKRGQKCTLVCTAFGKDFGRTSAFYGDLSTRYSLNPDILFRVKFFSFNVCVRFLFRVETVFSRDLIDFRFMRNTPSAEYPTNTIWIPCRQRSRPTTRSYDSTLLIPGISLAPFRHYNMMWDFYVPASQKSRQSPASLTITRWFQSHRFTTETCR